MRINGLPQPDRSGTGQGKDLGVAALDDQQDVLVRVPPRRHGAGHRHPRDGRPDPPAPWTRRSVPGCGVRPDRTPTEPACCSRRSSSAARRPSGAAAPDPAQRITASARPPKEPLPARHRLPRPRSAPALFVGGASPPAAQPPRHGGVRSARAGQGRRRRPRDPRCRRPRSRRAGAPTTSAQPDDSTAMLPSEHVVDRQRERPDDGPRMSVGPDGLRAGQQRAHAATHQSWACPAEPRQLAGDAGAVGTAPKMATPKRPADLAEAVRTRW